MREHLEGGRMGGPLCVDRCERDTCFWRRFSLALWRTGMGAFAHTHRSVSDSLRY